jgi:hypothetical protein
MSGDAEPEEADTGPDRSRGQSWDRVRAVGVAVGLLVAGLATSLVFGVAFTVPLVILGTDIRSPLAFLGLVAVGQLAFLVVGYAYVRRRGGVAVRRPSRRDAAYAVGGIVVALVAVAVLSVVVTALGVGPTGSVFDDPIATDPAVALGLAALSVVLVAPAEELLFRGAIQGRLRESFGSVGAILGSSLVFGAVHVANYTGSVVGALVGVAIVTVGGLVFGTIYERTGNLLVPIVTHGGYNSVLLVAAFLSA